MLDFLASTIDKLLSLIQGIYNGLLTVIGMLINGDIKELLAKLKNLVDAAMTAPGQFESAAYEELLGGNMDQPLSPMELQQAAAAGYSLPNAPDQQTAGAEAEQLPGPPWSTENVGVQQVFTGMELSPELAQQIMSQTGGDGEVTFGESDDPARSMESILGLSPDAQGNAESAQSGAQATLDDGLSPRQRAGAKWAIMKKGVSDWWSKNWPVVIGGGVLAVGGFIAANILTGGAITAALPAIMGVIGPLFLGMAVAQIGGHVQDYITKAWGGDIAGGGKSLAKGLAAGVIELISTLTLKAGSAALKGAKNIAKGAMRMAKGAANVARKSGQYILKQGKVLLKGITDGAIGRASKSLGGLSKRLLGRTKFRGFRIKVKSRRFRLEGKINPWVRIAEGSLPEGKKGYDLGDGRHLEVKSGKPKDARVNGWDHVDQKHLDSGVYQGKLNRRQAHENPDLELRQQRRQERLQRRKASRDFKGSQAHAESLGYTRYSHSRRGTVYHNSKAPRDKQYISKDIGSGDGSGAHNGGVWKAAESLRALQSKSSRTGTFNEDLTKKIGD